jgi:peptidyl-prolyl cis-trans isomerase C
MKSPALLLCALLLPLALPVQAQVLARVNGQAIPTAKADAMLNGLRAQGQQDSPQLRNAIREELITREIIMQESAKLDLLNNPAVAAEIENARQNVIIRAYVQDWVKKNPINDAELRKEYDRVKASMGEKEYLASHILVEKEDEAKKIIADLKKGAKFADLAKVSKDPGSKDKGGELDWAAPNTYVPEFSAAMVKLKKGEYTQTPVKSQFGFHVILVQDERAPAIPPFEEVKPQLAQAAQQQQLTRMREALRKGAKVE